jgi:hypothetical protein
VLPREAPVGGWAARSASGPLRPVLITIAVSAAALAAAGCGGDSGGAEDDPAQTTAELTFTLDADGPGGEPAQTAEVVCQRIGGSDFCPDLEGITAADFEPVSPQTACTEIFGGPDTLRVEGTLDGDPVDATFTRANGCEIDRFESFVPLLRARFPGYQPGSAIGP